MKSKKILIVDDNDLNRKLFENLLGQIYSFESAKNGREALTLAQSKAFDLILMDIQMPQMDGITAMKKIRMNPGHQCPIIAVTAFAEEDERSAFLSEGFDEFIIKPIRPREFLNTIQSVLQIKKENVIEETGENPSAILDKNILQQLFKYNSQATIKSVFEEFLNECSITEKFLENEQFDLALLENIHSLKGNSGTLGAQRIYQASQKVEEALRTNQMENWEELISTLKNEIKEFKGFLNLETIFEP
ncbi:Hpt domain-containing protein [Algoriphagus boseongensis]|uniref:Hpt domain-containing protein n=1 Tax=Algoriphagus boseongensis TaxID=1442587 RepID=A0A4R6T8T2_9BACT|nr:response regulator [Algoriphagus boseongensis]TDQ18573.1 Hpt domain-containing protein [Algoriphagus boseongensis]